MLSQGAVLGSGMQALVSVQPVAARACSASAAAPEEGGPLRLRAAILEASVHLTCGVLVGLSETLEQFLKRAAMQAGCSGSRL